MHLLRMLKISVRACLSVDRHIVSTRYSFPKMNSDSHTAVPLSAYPMISPVSYSDIC